MDGAAGFCKRGGKLQVLGIDLGKTVFHLVGLDSTGRVRFSARDVLAPTCWAFTKEFAGVVD